MAGKKQEILELALAEALRIRSGGETYMDFLSTAARNHKYGFRDQLLIHAQRPPPVRRWASGTNSGDGSTVAARASPFWWMGRVTISCAMSSMSPTPTAGRGIRFPSGRWNPGWRSR